MFVLFVLLVFYFLLRESLEREGSSFFLSFRRTELSSFDSGYSFFKRGNIKVYKQSDMKVQKFEIRPSLFEMQF